MKVKIFAILILVSLFFISCASTKNVPISNNCADDLRNHTVTCAEREIPDFSAYSAGKTLTGNMFGFVGAAVAANSMVSEGNKIISENGVEDPANYIAAQLMSGLVAKYQLNQANINSSTLESDDAEHISSLYKDADYVLDVKTVGWQTMPKEYTNRYLISYVAKLRLIDTNEKTIVAEGVCNKPYKEMQESDPAFSYDELKDNNAEALKNELKAKADYCVDHFKKNVFMMQ